MSAELFVSFSGMWMSIAVMYVYSFFATKVTSQIQTIGDRMYETDWNCFPLEFRLFVQLTINRSQRPLYFHGFGLVNCDMVNFSKVRCNTTFVSPALLFNFLIYWLILFHSYFEAREFSRFLLSHVQTHAIIYMPRRQTG